jgi:hypothetical protein
VPESELHHLIDAGDPIWRILRERLPPTAHAEHDLLVRLVAAARYLRASDPDRSREITDAVAHRLHVPATVIAGHAG